jgi:pyridoxine 4-dehydrogenase
MKYFSILFSKLTGRFRRRLIRIPTDRGMEVHLKEITLMPVAGEELIAREAGTGDPGYNGAVVDSAFRSRTMHVMSEKFPVTNDNDFDHGVTRRTFLGMTLAGGAALLAGRSTRVLEAASSTEASVAANPTFKLGGDLTVNRLGFGAMRITGPGIWGWPADRNNALKVLRRAVALGVDLIDTSDAYGPDTSELLIAEALYPYPKGLVIATKGGLTRPGPDQWVPDGHPERLKRCVEGSLKRLKLDRIDLYQLHRIDPKVPVEESLGALKEMQDAGKIRHIGLSEVSPEQIERANKVVPIVSAQNRYNIFYRKWDNTLDHCQKNGLGFLPWFPIGGSKGLKSDDALQAAAKAHGISKIQLALAWLLQRSPVMLPIPGTSSVPHLEENVAAAKIKLSAADWKQIDVLVKA